MTEVELVRVELAAKATGLNRYYLYRLAASGKVPHYRAGKALRFSVPELLAWMKAQAQQVKGNGSEDKNTAPTGRPHRY